MPILGKANWAFPGPHFEKGGISKGGAKAEVCTADIVMCSRVPFTWVHTHVGLFHFFLVHVKPLFNLAEWLSQGLDFSSVCMQMAF